LTCNGTREPPLSRATHLRKRSWDNLNERTGFDNRVALGYALVYPAAMIIKILLAQVLAGM